ncbi:MAG: AI-2E family transporter [Kiritimatiellae bacterium]|nr:AI-2E family transporter [Kiritimatiellia bacterium]
MKQPPQQNDVGAQGTRPHAQPGTRNSRRRKRRRPRRERGPAKPEPRAAGFDTRLSRYFFAGFAALVVVLFVLLVRPFLTELFLAFALFAVSKPLYERLHRAFKGRRALSSAVTCLLIVLIVFVPLVFFTSILASNVRDVYQYIAGQVASGELQQALDLRTGPLVAFVERYAPSIREYDLSAGKLVGNYLGTISEFVYANTVSVLRGFSSVLAGFILVIFTAFYMYMDGESFLAELKRLSPLDDRYDQEIIDELVRTIRLTFKGSLVIGLVQGGLGAIGFLVAGVGSWALWGLVMVFASFIPVVGTALIWVPAVIYLGVTGHYIAAGFLLLWGVAAIGVSDNLLRPYLLRGESKVHPLLIFFSVMGGLAYFGFLGIILGPLVLSLLIYVLRLYKRFFAPQVGAG